MHKANLNVIKRRLTGVTRLCQMTFETLLISNTDIIINNRLIFYDLDDTVYIKTTRMHEDITHTI